MERLKRRRVGKHRRKRKETQVLAQVMTGLKKRQVQIF